MESRYLSPHNYSLAADSIEAYDKPTNSTLDQKPTRHSRHNQPDQTKDRKKFEVSALPSPDSTPRVLRLPTPDTESSLLSPPLEIHLLHHHSPSFSSTASRPRADSSLSLSSDLQPLFSSTPKSLAEEFSTEKPRLPSFAEFVAATDLNRIHDENMENKLTPLVKGVWFKPDFRPNADQIIQVTQYVSERPAEWRKYSQIAHKRSLEMTLENRRERELAYRQAPEPARILSTTRSTQPVSPGRIKPPKRQRHEEDAHQVISVKKAAQPKRVRKSETDHEPRTPPLKKKRAAPNTENKEKFQYWREIAQWFAVIPEITPSMKSLAKSNHREIFGHFYQNGSQPPVPQVRLSANDRNIHLLADFEIEFAELLKWDTEKFLIHKLRLFRANFEELNKRDAKVFNKTRAQQSGQCDVNNMSRFFEVYTGVGMLSHQFIRESIREQWSEQAAKEYLGDSGWTRIQDPNTAKAELQSLRTSHRGEDSSAASISPLPSLLSSEASPITSAYDSSEAKDYSVMKKRAVEAEPQEMDQVNLAMPMYRDGLSKDRLF